MNVLVDTNVVLRVGGPEIRLRGEHDHVLQRLLDRGDILYMCTQVAIEYWSVATRPLDVNGLGLSPANAETRLRYFESLLVWLPEPDDIGARWRKIVNQCAVQGKKGSRCPAGCLHGGARADAPAHAQHRRLRPLPQHHRARPRRC